MSGQNTATASKTGTDVGFEGDVQRLGQYVGQLHDDLAGIRKSAGDAAHSGVAAAKASGRELLDEAKAKRERAAASLRDSIGRHPGAALGIAVGVGILIGLVGPAIVRSRRARS